MFSFHKPKVYRSPTGCCICKAKSSSSRFTDSKKYEEDFMECFQLATPRQGEICNACVLLVKRWKKLPAGSDRNWKHVVDARAGPGMKSMTKFKSKIKKSMENNNVSEKLKKKKPFMRDYSPTPSDKSDGTEDVDMTEVDFLSEDVPSRGSSRTASPGASDTEDIVVEKSRRHKALAKKRVKQPETSDFIDYDYWRSEEICCGTIYRGMHGELLINPLFLRPCSNCRIQTKPSDDTLLPDGTKTFSDSSSDSGYDDSSNQGAHIDNSLPFKKVPHIVSAPVISPLSIATPPHPITTSIN